MKSRCAEGLPAYQGLDQFHQGPGGSGLKGWRTSATGIQQHKNPRLGYPQKAVNRMPSENLRNDMINSMHSCMVIPFCSPTTGTGDKARMAVMQSPEKSAVTPTYTVEPLIRPSHFWDTG